MPVAGSRRKKATEIEMTLLGIDLPVDLIVATPEEVERQRDKKGSIFHAALRDGVVLYEHRP